jgi:restriction endonuclease S subunit
VILIKVNKSIDSNFINYVLKSPLANQKMITVSGATAQQAIYLRDIKDIEIPLCSIEEQNKIVQEIESRLGVADKMEESITQSLQQAEALRQSILKRAFKGRLIKTEIMSAI